MPSWLQETRPSEERPALSFPQIRNIAWAGRSLLPMKAFKPECAEHRERLIRAIQTAGHAMDKAIEEEPNVSACDLRAASLPSDRYVPTFAGSPLWMHVVPALLRYISRLELQVEAMECLSSPRPSGKRRL